MSFERCMGAPSVGARWPSAMLIAITARRSARTNSRAAGPIRTLESTAEVAISPRFTRGSRSTSLITSANASSRCLRRLIVVRFTPTVFEARLILGTFRIASIAPFAHGGQPLLAFPDDRVEVAYVSTS